MDKIKSKLGYIVPGLFAIICTGVTVSSSGISVSDSDVSSIMTPMTSWAGSFFDVLIKFAPVFIVVFFIYLIVDFIRKHKD